MAGGDTNKPVGVLVEELRDLVVDYVKQETVDPAKQLGKRFAFSIAGGTVLGIGFVMALLGILRLFQTEVWVFPEPGTNWSWLPYVLTAVAGVIIVLVVVASIQRAKST